MATNLPSYHPVKADGALWKCYDCEALRSHDAVYLVRLPNGESHILCKNCIDPDWMEIANKGEPV